MVRQRRLDFKKEDYEFRGLDDLPIPLDANVGLYTSPFVQLVGGKDANNAVMPMKVDSTGRLDVIGVCPTQQTPIYLDQANPTTGNAYELLPTTELCRIIGASVRVTWTVQPTPLEMHGTIDDITYLWSKGNPVSNTWYNAQISTIGPANNQSLGTAVRSREEPYLLEARSAALTVETTGGTVSNLEAYVHYATW